MPLGEKWLDSITTSLKNCSVEIVICSPKSITRPWINFEAGAGWIKDIPVIPLCHSGMEPSKLPLPLNLLQAAKATELASLKLIMPVLAQAIGSQTPNVDLIGFINKVKDFEAIYTFWSQCNAAFKELDSLDARILPALQQGMIVNIELTENQIHQINNLIPYLQQHNILQFQQSINVNGVPTTSSKITPTGTVYSCSLIPLSKLQEVLKDKRFNLKK